MRTVLLRVALATALLIVTCAVMAQTTSLPATPTATEVLPTVSQPTGTGSAAADDANVAPPPTATPVLPSNPKQTFLMVKRGQKELEWRLSYSHFSSNSVFIDGVAMLPVMVIGQVDVQSTRKDLLIAQITGRYGIVDNLQAEIGVPFRYERDINSMPNVSPPEEKDISGTGLGDIEGTLYYQLPKKTDDAIRWIVSAGVKTATGRDLFSIDPTTQVPIGSGFWSSQFGLSGVKVCDPAAVYWNLNYTYNWLRQNIRVVSHNSQTNQAVVSYVDVKPGNTISIGGGVAYALNPKISLNTGLTVSFNGSTTNNGANVVNTAITTASYCLGVVWITDRQFPIDVTMNMGLTRDSPDFTLDIRENYQL